MGTFHGLEMAKQALFAQQAALYTTGHNISNANTEGYSRQRVNFETASPYTKPGRNRPEIPGQMGAGVEIGSVQRIRHKFLDQQFRAENSKTGYWNITSDSLNRMEGLINELSESGLSKTMDQFWESLEDLSVDSGKSGARPVAVERGLAVADTFNYLADNLHSIRSDLKKQIDVTVSDANSLLRQINQINEEVRKIEAHGSISNDLYDERDRLIDQLSEVMNIKVIPDKSGESSLAIADGVVSIEVVDRKGLSFNPPIRLINSQAENDEKKIHELAVSYRESNGAVMSIVVDGYESDIEALDLMQSVGSLTGLIETYGYSDGSDDVLGTYPNMITDLDRMATVFAEAFNEQHRKGVDIQGDHGETFFIFSEGSKGAGSITVNQSLIEKPDKLAAGIEGQGSQNGDNALELAKLFDKDLVDLENSSIRGFFGSLIGKMGVDAEEANRMSDNTDILRLQVEEQRMSVSAVSLDEEMSNMIKFQHAYNAAARSMTTIDEMLERIINGMGLVGR